MLSMLQLSAPPKKLYVTLLALNHCFQEMENLRNRRDQLTIQNNRKLNEGLRVAYECDAMADNCKVELNQQSHKMKNSVLRNLKEIQGDLNVANRLLVFIKKQRQKNKLILYGIVFLMIAAACFILYKLIFSSK